jgi:CheY-like chemotaxis protein
MQERDVTVIVTDMKMPGMDGAELLETVARCHPRAMRLVLSGYAEPLRMQRAKGNAHRYLRKPCPAAQLEAEIRGAIEVRKTIDTFCGLSPDAVASSIGPEAIAAATMRMMEELSAEQRADLIQRAALLAAMEGSPDEAVAETARLDAIPGDESLHARMMALHMFDAFLASHAEPWARLAATALDAGLDAARATGDPSVVAEAFQDAGRQDPADPNAAGESAAPTHDPELLASIAWLIQTRKISERMAEIILEEDLGDVGDATAPGGRLAAQLAAMIILAVADAISAPRRSEAPAQATAGATHAATTDQWHQAFARRASADGS